MFFICLLKLDLVLNVAEQIEHEERIPWCMFLCLSKLSLRLNIDGHFSHLNMFKLKKF